MTVITEQSAASKPDAPEATGVTPPPWPLRYQVLPGCRLGYLDSNPAGPAESPLLLVHGGHGAWVHWRRNLEALAMSHRVVVPDMPGFGASGELGAPDIETVAGELSAFIDLLGLRGITIAGFSFGTLVTAALARLRPDAIARVLLINPPGLGTRSTEASGLHDQIAMLAREAGLRSGVRATLQKLMLANPACVTEAMVDDFEYAVRRTRFVTRDISRSIDLLPCLGALTQPLRVLIGEQDPYHRHELEARRQRVNDVRGEDCVALVPGAAHWVQHERADLFQQTLLAFAAKVA